MNWRVCILLLGAQDQWRGAEHDQLPYGSAGTSSGDCEKQWKLVWFGHVTRHSSLSKTILQGTLEGRWHHGQQSKIIDGQRQTVDIPTHARTAHDDELPQKRQEEDLGWIVLHVPPDAPVSQGTTLNWLNPLVWETFVRNCSCFFPCKHSILQNRWWPFHLLFSCFEGICHLRACLFNRWKRSKQKPEINVFALKYSIDFIWNENKALPWRILTWHV